MNLQDALWFVPEAVLNRVDRRDQDKDWAEFLLCGFYCAVAVTFLLIFGVAAILRDENSYAMVILGFAVTTCIMYGAIWLSGQFHLARHFVVTLMGALCLFLFHTGGTENTGPMYYFVFPVVAVFLQGIRLGSISVIALFLITLVIQESSLFGFDTTRYSLVFITRIYSIYLIISILAFLFAWFMEKAERELLLSKEDLERILHADPQTGLSNRSFMERLLRMEHNRFKRYNYPFCLLAIKVDNHETIRQRYGIKYSNDILAHLAQLLMNTLRNVDIPARWDPEVLLVMMPQSGLTESRLMAERVREEIQRQTSASGSFTVSIGISEIADNLDEAIASAEENLRIAAQENGNSVVSSKAPGSEHYSDKDLPEIYINL